ncbi:dTMP kinase [Schleiferilactobacillus harbinensis]|uniref:dTMP kinase n=1 Tax=Schleiferilactobacillus harbinensis TaxID=304207 RepID=UPI0004121ADF|nr:dTMP kinase [Schleiferilactobacillus harbinensis]QFR64495.1 dTMP kinase [Schleiferilactobacillus harbinensis]
MNGLFISFEGPDGAGKSSMLQQLVPVLEAYSDHSVVLTREPGGSPIAEQIRHVILDSNNTDMAASTEALLYAAARAQHLHDVIRPALRQGKIVLSDRYVDSSIAYQGAGRELGTDAVAAINRFATNGTMPQLTVYVDVPPAVGIARIQHYRAQPEDRLEEAGAAFHDRVRAAYQALAHQEQQRIVTVDGTQPIQTVADQAWAIIQQRFPAFFNI